MENEIIMALDVSTSCIGISIAACIEGKLKILEVTHLKLKVPKKVPSVAAKFRKAKQFKEAIEKYKDYGITRVVIEEPLSKSNNVNTVSTLARFNGMISIYAVDVLGIEENNIDFISSYDARKYAFPELLRVRKYNKKGEIYPATQIRSALKKSDVVLFGDYPWDVAKKDVLWGKISDLFPEIEWKYNKKGELSNENFDASDSLVCLLGYLSKLQYEGCEPSVTKWEQVADDKFTYTVSFCGNELDCEINL